MLVVRGCIAALLIVRGSTSLQFGLPVPLHGIFGMAPKRSSNRRLYSASPVSNRGVSMKLRSGHLGKRGFDEEASSRVMSLGTPLKKRAKSNKKCIFVDDEAQVEEDSNNITEQTKEPQLNEDHEDVSNDSGADNVDSDDPNNKHSRQLGKKVPLGLMRDVLGQFYVRKKTQPPLVPLARLVPHEAVRFASDSASWLVSTFDSAAYLENMGHFLVSVAGPGGGPMPVTDANLEEWGPIWRQKNEAFERALPREWQHLKGKKFLVWDGNHRLKTWMKRIKDVYADSPEYHVSVRCQFIEVDKMKEAELLLALDTTNAITRAHVTPNIGHEVYMFQKFGIADKDSILARLTPDQRKWAEVEMTIESRFYHGTPPWYNTPCVLISQLVWKDEFNAYIAKETAKIESKGLPQHEIQTKIEAAIRAEEERLKDRGYKYLCIANPNNGEEFFKILYGLKWEETGMMKITRDKLYCLTSAKISSERKKTILHLMSLTKAKDQQFSYFGDYKSFRGYMKKEVYWAHLYSEACLIIRKIEVEGPMLPKDFDDYYKISMKNHILQAYVHLLSTVKASEDQDKMPELDFSAKRLIYRWFLQCIDANTLEELPPAPLSDWLDLKDENCMYSPSMQDRGITLWEVDACPWWLEYPIGVIPKQETDLRERFLSETANATTSNEPLIDEAQILATPHDARTEATTSHVQIEPIIIEDKKGKKPLDSPSSKVNTPYVVLGAESSKKSLPIPSSSFVVESSLGRSIWERRPSTRSVGFQYTTIVDALLVDITCIDKFALDSINKFLSTQKIDLYSKNGVPCREVARLIFADFPTSLVVDGLSPSPTEGMSVPSWNVFSKELVVGTMDLANEYLADEGFLVTLCLAEHIGELIMEAFRVGLTLHRTWTLFCDQVAYRHPVTREAVLDLTICLWHRVGVCVPTYDREAGEVIDKVNFPAYRSYVLDYKASPTIVNEIPARGGAQRSIEFFRWLLATFTNRCDYVLDLFAGCGGLGIASAQEHRHCICMEKDDVIHDECLSVQACGPVPC